ncbi:MAG: tRNA uridine-5-carboxymethylaminomethyl(34) synthesis GTPase MnmE [Prevotellaceae bacterium]|jgi:tRNA modification GTPase|nr:tRNA uridine-5-carboxymethylaminomethyl(34) synthesis GTPase MnmE [Prevotellaceae bacterium]
MYSNSTICAVSTASGVAGVAVIRISGERAIGICEQIFTPKKSGKPLASQKSHSLSFGRIMDGEKVIDEVLVSVFRAPHSFTGEEVVEIACHGSPYIQQQIMQLLIRHGARAAAAGEFTQRAFLNGRMDLAQAEAVADLIVAENAAAHQVAMQQMRGGFSQELQELREQLLNFVSLLELELDFSEEDVEFADRSQLNQLLAQLQSSTGRLLQSFSLGNVIKNGVPVAILGATNVGKSTLLNALLGEERAIVSDIHGTTRDSIEDTITLNGIQFRFIDTAGLRHSSETIEQLGIMRTYDKLRQAAIVLLVLDTTRQETFATIDEIKAQLNENQQLIVVVNKADLQEELQVTSYKLQGKKVQGSSPFTLHPSPFTLITISAKYKQGIDQLIAALAATVNLSPLSRNEIVLTNVRHYEALQATAEALERVSVGINAKLPHDLVAQNLREVLHHLGAITGAITTNEILGTIFGRFCIGK